LEFSVERGLRLGATVTASLATVKESRMNEEFEGKLIALMNEAKARHMPAAQVVLHLLIGCHSNGTQSDFAKWCCQFSPVQSKLSFARPEVCEDFPNELDLGD
jgi:hypothetical protein